MSNFFVLWWVGFYTDRTLGDIYFRNGPVNPRGRTMLYKMPWAFVFFMSSSLGMNCVFFYQFHCLFFV